MHDNHRDKLWQPDLSHACSRRLTEAKKMRMLSNSSKNRHNSYLASGNVQNDDTVDPSVVMWIADPKLARQRSQHEKSTSLKKIIEKKFPVDADVSGRSDKSPLRALDHYNDNDDAGSRLAGDVIELLLGGGDSGAGACSKDSAMFATKGFNANALLESVCKLKEKKRREQAVRRREVEMVHKRIAAREQSMKLMMSRSLRAPGHDLFQKKKDTNSSQLSLLKKEVPSLSHAKNAKASEAMVSKAKPKNVARSLTSAVVPKTLSLVLDESPPILTSHREKQSSVEYAELATHRESQLKKKSQGYLLARQQQQHHHRLPSLLPRQVQMTIVR
jgi:hypothetical protein